MPIVPLEPRTAFFLLGVVYLMMSGLVWRVLRGPHGGAATALWCAGGVVIGASYLGYSLRGAVPAAVSVVGANLLGLWGVGLRIESLRIEGRRDGSAWPTVLVFAAGGALSLASSLAGEDWRRPVNLALLAGAAAWLALEARRLRRSTGSQAALLIGISYAILVGALALRLATIALADARTPALTPALDLVAVLAGGLAAGLFGNVGYIGLALETLQARREAQARDLALEQSQRARAEALATALRERLAEREEFVRVLAHEVRQPLNNASAALQGARAALTSNPLGESADEAAQRLQRAQNVIAHIVGSIDNTLAATTLLASAQPLAPRDADVNMLVELSLGDLDPAQRARVRRQGSGHARTAAMDIVLMRLALRNLLANALAYSPPDAPVTLQVSDTDEPLGLAFEVRDLGPGLPPRLRERVFERGVRGDHGMPGHGLGLYVVREIMRRHGGQASWAPNTPGGSVFRLWLPIVE